MIADDVRASAFARNVRYRFETSVCIVDDAGKIVREAREALLQVVTTTIYRFKRIGLEAGPLSQWLYSVLAEVGLPVICVETRHMRAVLKAQINKTDRNDARGIAQMMRVGLYRPVHVPPLYDRPFFGQLIVNIARRAGVCGMRRRHEPRGWHARRTPGRGDFSISKIHPDLIPGNLVRSISGLEGGCWP